jgi:hypothetical protein
MSVALERVDAAREARDVGGEDALAALAPGDLVLLALDLGAEVLLLAARDERQQGEQGERHQRHADQQAEP